MSDNCLHAQRVLSEASDGLPVSAEDLKNAKAHCAACSDCLAFVSGLAALKKSASPEAPAGLADRVIAAVREDIERAEAEAEAATALLAAQTAASAEAGEDADVLPITEPAPRLDLSIDNWRTWVPWAGAAAVLLVVAGFAVMQGARFIAGTSSDASYEYVDSASEMGAAPPYAVESQEDAANESETTRATQEGAENAEYIDFGGWAYVFVRDSARPSSLVTAGVVVTSLDSDDPASQHTVFEGPGAYTIVLEDGEDYLEFDLVLRSSRGRQYAMTVGPVTSFAEWPLPPSGLRMPTHADGSPVFTRGASDDQGQPMYLPGDDYPREGYGVAPDTPGNDPAAGNPNWTWWEPID